MVRKSKQVRPCPYKIIDRRQKTEKTSLLYEILDATRDKSHTELKDAKIGLAWRLDMKPDADGHLELGRCIKCPTVHRELHGMDFVIALNFEAVNKADFSRAQLEALIDHELCHAAPSLNRLGEQKRDGDSNLQWRIRKHDIQEFHEVVARHGCYKADLEAFARCAAEKLKEPLLTDVVGKIGDAVVDAAPGRIKAPKGGTVTVSSNGGKSVTIDDQGQKVATA